MHWLLASSLVTLAIGISGCGNETDTLAPQASLLHIGGEAVLSEPEQRWISTLLEEEKLARDVYLALAERWPLPIFAHIAAAEQRHLDRVSALLQSLGAMDPLFKDEPGHFAMAHFAELYEQLVSRGSSSVDEALRVGAAIEELDLTDLAAALAAATNNDARRVWTNLAKGSRNHLRAFVGQLTARGSDYIPQHLSPDEFARIISRSAERGPIDGTCQANLDRAEPQGWRFRRDRSR